MTDLIKENKIGTISVQEILIKLNACVNMQQCWRENNVRFASDKLPKNVTHHEIQNHIWLNTQHTRPGEARLTSPFFFFFFRSEEDIW